MPKQTPLQTLEDAIAIALSNGWEKGDLSLIFTLYSLPELLRHNRFYMIIFDHSFAKSLWGDKKVKYYDLVDLDNGGKTETITMPRFHYHLKQMAVAEDPLKYLEQNLLT